MNCSFFGHADTVSDIKSRLKEEILKLYYSEEIECYYVGNNGNFDFLVQSVLLSL